jgi:hypothetical protein
MVREIPEPLRRVESYKVRILARTPGPASSALFDVAASRRGKTEWTPGEWKGLLDELDGTELTVGEWLKQ